MGHLKYSLIIEPTNDPDFFCFYSPELEGFTGTGESVDDCIAKARLGIREHVHLLQSEGLPVPPENPNATVTLRDTRHIVPAA
jgi:predicted RNase H-like HicB family nuclease